jgi:hypothetical protein
VIEGFATLAGGSDQNGEVLFDPFLPDQIVQHARPDVLIHAVFRLWQGINEARAGRFSRFAGCHKVNYTDV